MKNNDTGEFELVLGNRQLLSGFFIIVILFAVFFVMGYIVGRNSAPGSMVSSGRDQGNAAVGSLPAQSPRTSTGTASAPPESASNPAGTEPGPKETASGAEAGTQPATPSAGSEPTAKNETSGSAPSSAASPGDTDTTSGGTYLQVTAVKAEVAETVARALKDKGFPCSLSPGPAGKTRVLVGPYPDLASLGKAKADLENLGFSPFVKK
jgi:cell division septation protein DedD